MVRDLNGCVRRESCTTPKYVGVMDKVKHYISNQALRMLYHSLINPRVQYGIIAWGRAAHVICSQYRLF